MIPGPTPPDLSAIFRRVAPHIVTRDFLGAAGVERMLSHAQAVEAQLQPARVGYAATARLAPEVRISSKMVFSGDAATEFVQAVTALVPSLLARLSMPLFPPVAYEVELVAHGDGAFYRRHLDLHAGEHGPNVQRMLSAVYYFYRQPRAFSGGALRIYSFDGSAWLDLEPDNDILVAFPTSAPHEVLPVTVPSHAFIDSRFAVNCWVLKAREPARLRDG